MGQKSSFIYKKHLPRLRQTETLIQTTVGRRVSSHFMCLVYCMLHLELVCVVKRWWTSMQRALMQVRRGFNCEFSKHLEPGRLVWGIPLALPKHQSKAQAPRLGFAHFQAPLRERQDKTRQWGAIPQYIPREQSFHQSLRLIQV